MAIIWPNTYPTGATPVNAEYPEGAPKNVSSLGNDGLPSQRDWVNNLWGFLQGLMDEANQTFSDVPEQVGNSDYLKAFKKIINNETGIKGPISGLETDFAVFENNLNFTFKPGVATTGDFTIELTDPITKLLADNWAAGSFENGIFQGTLSPDTTYHLLVIADSTGVNPVDAGFDTSVITPNLPPGYDKFVRVASIKTNSSAGVDAYQQFGDYFFLKERKVLRSGARPLSGSESISVGIPEEVRMRALIFHSQDATARTKSKFFEPLYQLIPAEWNYNVTRNPTTTLDIHSDIGGASVDWVFSNDSTIGNVSFILYGWVDARGKNSV